MTVDYRGLLREAASPELAAFNSRITPGKDNITGVPVPVVRRIARRVILDDWSQVFADEPASFEEEMLRGIVIATAPIPTKLRIALTKDYMRFIDNWAVCDVFCASWRYQKADEVLIWDFFSSLMDSGAEFPMRTSIVARMHMFKDESRSRMLLEDIAAHDNPGYYYRMGAAWAVSEIYVRQPGMVMELLRSGRMEPWTHNKAIRKIRESRRVSAERKAELDALRRTVP